MRGWVSTATLGLLSARFSADTRADVQRGYRLANEGAARISLLATNHLGFLNIVGGVAW